MYILYLYSISMSLVKITQFMSVVMIQNDQLNSVAKTYENENFEVRQKKNKVNTEDECLARRRGNLENVKSSKIHIFLKTHHILVERHSWSLSYSSFP